MQKDSVFTLKLEPDLHAAFKQAAEATHRPASQVVRELMRDFIEQQKEKAVYEAYLEKKVSAARQSVDAKSGKTHTATNSEFESRKQVLRDTLVPKN